MLSFLCALFHKDKSILEVYLLLMALRLESSLTACLYYCYCADGFRMTLGLGIPREQMVLDKFAQYSVRQGGPESKSWLPPCVSSRSSLS